MLILISSRYYWNKPNKRLLFSQVQSWSKPTYSKKKCIERSLYHDNFIMSQERYWNECRRSGQKGWLIVFHFLSPAFLLPLTLITKPQNCSSSCTPRDHNSILSFSVGLLYFKFLEAYMGDHGIIPSVFIISSFLAYVTSATHLWRVWKFFQWIFCCTNVYTYQRIFNSRFSSVSIWVFKHGARRPDTRERLKSSLKWGRL